LEGDPVTEERAKRKLSAILSADVKGYSRLMGEDEIATVRTLEAYREMIAEVIRNYSGRVVDSPGDNLLAEFSSVVDAVESAVEIQKELKAKNEGLPENRRMEFRIGINLGDVIEEGERIYGDGVNIAARIEGLAEGGGICISRTAFDQVRNKLKIGYEYLGEHSVKNIAQPVRVYRVLMEPEASGMVIGEEIPRRKQWRWAAVAAVLVAVAGALAIWNFYFRPPQIEPASLEKVALPLPDKPSIAVLPFKNLSDDSAQEYFSDGITNDLITDLSKFRELIVLASNKTFKYKGKEVDPNKVGNELGARYILNGSVQKAGKQVRINAQLSDATTEHHIWAERYERNLKDLFELQNEIVESIVRTLALKIEEAERTRVLYKQTRSIDAYDNLLKGWHHFYQMKSKANREARKYFKKALKIDPNYASAYVALSRSRILDAAYGWTEFPEKALGQAHDLAKKAIEIDPSDASAHATIGYIFMRQSKYALAMSELQKTIELNPNDYRSYRNLGAVMLYAGHPDKSLKWYEIAMAYDPGVSAGVFMNIGIAYYLKGSYDEALNWLNKGAGRWPNFLGNHIILAATYAQAGRIEEAKKEAGEIKRLAPFFELDFYGAAYKNKEHRDKIVDGLIKAGLK
jgi:adenylate cyclase